jgi:hypothetical protein
MATDEINQAGVQARVLATLRQTIEEETQGLTQAITSGTVPAVAWRARNLLELSIWTEYCLLSEANAHRFDSDSTRDALDSLDLPDGMFSKEPAFSYRTERERLLSMCKDAEISGMDEIFTRVSNAAKATGWSDAFKYANKLLSKFAHPTALRVIAPKCRYEGMRRIFGESGLMYIAELLSVALMNS